MEIKEIRRLVQQGEHDHLEFKRRANHPEKIVREVVAFANTSGGRLLIGVDDNGSIPGLKFPEDDLYSLNKAIEERSKPKITYQYEIVPLDETESRFIIVYQIKEGKKKPHLVTNELPETGGKVYVRVADRSIQASREVREIIRRIGKGKGTAFQYGEKEKQLLSHLDQHGSITLSEFASLAQIPKKIASRTLILLCLAKVLEIHPSDKEDQFTLIEQVVV